MAICLFELLWCQYDFIYSFIYFVAGQRRMRWNRRRGGLSPSLEAPSLGAWDNTECIDHLQRCSPPSKDHKVCKGESAVLHNSEQLAICWEIHWCYRMMPPHRNWWWSPQRCLFWASSRLLIFPAKLVLFFEFLKWDPEFAKWKEKNKKDWWGNFFLGFLQEWSTKWKEVNFKAEIVTVVRSVHLALAKYFNPE